jgi:hypothetical protein
VKREIGALNDLEKATGKRPPFTPYKPQLPTKKAKPSNLAPP